MTAGYLVGYDVEGVHRYVFEPVRPVDVAGGSRILENFADRAGGLAVGMGCEPIYSAGGAGLFRAPDVDRARELVHELPQLLDRATAGGVRCSSAFVELTGGAIGARRRLAHQLRRERLRRQLSTAPVDLFPAGTRPSTLCEGCGRETAIADRNVGGRGERIGPRCQARYGAGRGTGPATIPELFGQAEEDLPRGAVLAALYVDADGLGEHLAQLQDLGPLRTFSARLVKGVRDAAAAASGAISRPTLQVVAGGDDVLLFCDGGLVLDLADALRGALQPLHDELGVRFSTGLAVGEPYVPLRLFFQEAEVALKTAKHRSYQSGVAHVGVRSLLVGTRHAAAGDVFGGPLPEHAFRRDGSPGVRETLEALSRVASAQRAGLGDDLAAVSREEVELALDYRAVRDSAVLAALERVRALAATGADAHALLRGALAFVRFGERAP